MKIKFDKYQGTGNDFVMIDNRKNKYEFKTEQIKELTDRRFGIGADGVILIENHTDLDFEMRYFNADGTRSFCGNGARCAVRFSESLGLCKDETNFLAIDGEHQAKIYPNAISLQMREISGVENDGEAFVIDTGSPHYVSFVDDLSKENIVKRGKEIRYSKKYSEKGINVNLVQENTLEMLTYERGVENETLSCGTGATAVAIAYAKKNNLEGLIALDIKVKGGDLQVGFNKTDVFSNIFLKGPAQKVFSGVYEL